jgi:hypothetical protein
VKKQSRHEKDITTQSIIFLQNTVNGSHHNIISQSKLKQVHQTNDSNLENELLKKEIFFLKSDVEFIKRQLEILQSLFEEVLEKK